MRLFRLLCKNLLVMKGDGQTGAWGCSALPGLVMLIAHILILQSEGQSGCLPGGFSAVKGHVHVVILCLVTQDSLLLPSLIFSKFFFFLQWRSVSALKDLFFEIKLSETSAAGGQAVGLQLQDIWVVPSSEGTQSLTYCFNFREILSFFFFFFHSS